MANRLVTQVMSDVSDLACVLANMSLNKLTRIIEYKDADEVTIKGSNNIGFELNSKWWLLDTDVDVATGADIDTGAISNGKDYYVYACDNGGGFGVSYLPGFDISSRLRCRDISKIRWFPHPLCRCGHNRRAYADGFLRLTLILPQSVWDLKHRALSGSEGMVWSDEAGLWG